VFTYCKEWQAQPFLPSVSKDNMCSYYDRVCLCCDPSANAICIRIMDEFVVVLVSWKTQHVVITWLGLSFFTVSKHNMWLYYGWVTDDNNDKPNYNKTTYCVYWLTKTTTNPTIIRPHTVFADEWQQLQTQPWYKHTLCLLTVNNYYYYYYNQ
jgi:hypothetical protein